MSSAAIDTALDTLGDLRDEMTPEQVDRLEALAGDRMRTALEDLVDAALVVTENFALPTDDARRLKRAAIAASRCLR